MGIDAALGNAGHARGVQRIPCPGVQAKHGERLCVEHRDFTRLVAQRVRLLRQMQRGLPIAKLRAEPAEHRHGLGILRPGIDIALRERGGPSIGFAGLLAFGSIASFLSQMK